MTSLRQFLNDEIRLKGYLSLEQVHAIALEMGHKSSNAERRLRASESPQVEAVRNKKGHIVGYKWVGETVLDPIVKKYPDLFIGKTKEIFSKQQSFL